MERPKKEDFDNGDHITDWLYWEQKYTEALNKYIDWIDKQLTLTSVNHQRELLNSFAEEWNVAPSKKEWIYDRDIESFIKDKTIL